MIKHCGCLVYDAV